MKKKPAHNIVLPEEYAKLPEWQLRMAIQHATSHVEDVMGLKDTDPKYYKSLEKEATKYLDEGIKESMTPHMVEGENPTTAIAEDVFKLSPVFSIDGIFLRRLEAPEREKYYQRIRAAVNTLAGVFNEVALRLNKSRYAIGKGASAEEKRETKVAQFQRVFLDTAMAALLESVFRANPKGFDDFIREGLAQKNLNDPKVREDFIKKVRDQVTKEGFTPESLRKIFE